MNQTASRKLTFRPVIKILVQEVVGKNHLRKPHKFLWVETRLLQGVWKLGLAQRLLLGTAVWSAMTTFCTTTLRILVGF